MLINTEEYTDILKSNYPDHNFNVVFQRNYKNNSEIYQIVIDDGEHEFDNFDMTVGLFSFTEEQLKNNFINVAGRKIINKVEDLEKAAKIITSKDKEEKKVS